MNALTFLFFCMRKSFLDLSTSAFKFELNSGKDRNWNCFSKYIKEACGSCLLLVVNILKHKSP